MPHPFASMGSAIVSSLGARASITVRRFGAGAYDATGRFSAGGSFDTPATAVVQPSTAREINKLPEGERSDEAITLFTTAKLQTSHVASSGKGDQVLWDGKTYEVRLVEDWTAQAGYSRAVATRRGQ